MRDLLDRAMRVYETPNGKRMIRYTLVSVISTAFSLALIAVVFGVLRLWSEVPSVIFANVVASVPAYYLNRKWAWGKSGKSHLVKEVLPFWLASLAALALSTYTAAWARDYSRDHQLHHFAATVVVMVASLAAYGFLWIGKFLIFNQLFKHVHVHAHEVGTVDQVELVES